MKRKLFEHVGGNQFVLIKEDGERSDFDIARTETNPLDYGPILSPTSQDGYWKTNLTDDELGEIIKNTFPNFKINRLEDGSVGIWVDNGDGPRLLDKYSTQQLGWTR
jgi:hypothetical protein